VYGGHECGRPGRFRVGLAVPPHPPKDTQLLCAPHVRDYAYLNKPDDDGIEVSVVQLQEDA
jgi:hypothetical protein